jgi:DASS family divalent anion:Na+ symporter
MALPRLDNWQTRAAQGFEQTGLGDRMATLFVRAFGKSTLGLAYGLSVAEALVAPAMPSTTARAGGIFMPIINSLALANGSKPGARARLKPHGIGLVSDSRVQRR